MGSGWDRDPCTIDFRDTGWDTGFFFWDGIGIGILFRDRDGIGMKNFVLKKKNFGSIS